MAEATKMADVPLDVLFENADVVASVEIVSGERIDPNDKECGYQYRGSVLTTYKGAPGATLTFGRSQGIEMGGRYLLFLTEPSKEYRELASTNTVSRSYEDELAAKCQKKWTILTTMQGFAGAIRMSTEYRDPWIEILSQFVKLPEESANRFRPHPPALSPPLYAEPIWTYEEDVDKYLKELKGK